jgi:hypothetical protein
MSPPLAARVGAGGAWPPDVTNDQLSPGPPFEKLHHGLAAVGAKLGRQKTIGAIAHLDHVIRGADVGSAKIAFVNRHSY